MSKAPRYYEESVLIPAFAEDVFSFIDDHSRLSAHMARPSWMMGGGRMEAHTDERRGQKVGSHIRLSGKALGIRLFLDEVVAEYEPPYRKTWQTVGDVNLLVIGHYRMGFVVGAENGSSRLTVFIDYELPQSPRTRWLGYLFGRIYAIWCVRQMLKSARQYFI